MDVAILEPEDIKSVHQVTKLFGIRNIGKKRFWFVIHGISNLDLGERCGREWARRLNWLRLVWGIRGELPFS